MDKKKIEIEVDPHDAVVVIGIIRGFLPSIYEYLEEGLKGRSRNLLDGFSEKSLEVLNEIYEKCIVHTEIREKAQEVREYYETFGTFPDEENIS